VEVEVKKGDLVYAARVGFGSPPTVEVGEAAVKCVRKDGWLDLSTRVSAFGFRAQIPEASAHPSRHAALSALAAEHKQERDEAAQKLAAVLAALAAEAKP
jgi:hypothetical protein